MNKETYKRLFMDVTEFDAEDVIATSELAPTGDTPPAFNPDPDEGVNTNPIP